MARCMQGAVRMAPMIVGLCLAVGCASLGRRSAVKVVNGHEDETSHPATVVYVAATAKDEILLFCSGTFVRDDLVVTAAHCTQAPGTAKFVLFGRAKNWQGQHPVSTSYTLHPDFSMDEPSPRPTDIAFLHWPRGTAEVATIAKIATAEDWHDQAVTIVGYGGAKPNWQWEPLGIRRSGTNEIGGLWYGGPYRMIKMNTENPVQSTDNAVINEGDSGGALYTSRGELAGVGQSGRFDQARGAWDTRFIDLQVPSIARYISAEIGGSNPVLDLRDKKSAGAALVADMPRCLDQSGLGYGPMTPCGTRMCAKLAADLKEPCRVWPTLSGRNFCTANLGRGYGAIFDCEGQRCAKNDAALKTECVLLSFVE